MAEQSMDCWTIGATVECVACGQTAGVIQAHAEDYSEPFRAGVTDGFHLCIICHAMVHGRAKSPKAWRDYRAMVEAGGRAKVMRSNQNFLGAMAQFVDRPITADRFDWGSPPARRALLEIEVSQDEAAERIGVNSGAVERGSTAAVDPQSN